MLRRAWLRLLPDGAPAVISGVTRIGRGLQAEFRIESNRMGKLHSRVWAERGTYWVADLGSTYGTWLTRAGVMMGRIGSDEAELEHGDVIGLNERVEFTIEPRSVDAVAAALVAKLESTPDDAATWAAYADRLLELGDPLGARIANAMEGASWPGNLVGHYLTDVVSMEWAHGHVRSAAFVPPTLPQVTLAGALKVLFASREGRFVQSLRLPVDAYEAQEGRLAEVLRERPATLRAVTFDGGGAR